MQTGFKVAGMDCADEVIAVTRTLQAVPGVHQVWVDLMASSVHVDHSSQTPKDRLEKAILAAGLELVEKRGIQTRLQPGKLASVLLSGLLGAAGMGLHHPLWFVASILTGSWSILPKALAALRRLSLDMNVLMMVAVAGAAGIGQWSEAAAVVFLFSLAELLESYSAARARSAIQSLLELSPETAWLQQDGSFVEVPVEEVPLGGIVSIRSGMRVPLDGEVTAGRSYVNQAPITGESVPVEKNPGQTVFAGTINQSGSLEVRVNKAHKDTMLARIIQLVEVAQSQKAPSQQFVDRFARYYTPSVMVAALLVWLVPPLAFAAPWPVWIYRSLVLLVIACPCALVISTPVSIVSGLTAMARRGVLIKGGAALETIGHLRAVATDKTGTITEGRPRVLRVISFEDTPEKEIIRVAAAIDAHSDHPLAQAVLHYADEQDIEYPRSVSYQERSGRGAEGELDGHHYFVGNHRFTHELGVCSQEIEKVLVEIESQAQSVVVVGHKPHADCPGTVLGVLAVGDTLRPGAAEAVQALHAAGVRSVIMLSGDNQRTVDAIARQVGIDVARGDLLPEDKVEVVKALVKEHRYVAMIGDGVNDAPAMASATLGVAMGAAGTDTALETADLALMQDELGKLAETVHLGRRTLGIIRVNIGFSLAVKAIFLVLALFGQTSLWMAIFADTGATLLVIGNALRLLRLPSQGTES